MHWLRFLTYNAIGAALWVGFWVLVPYYLGGHHVFALWRKSSAGRARLPPSSLIVALAYAGYRYFKARYQALDHARRALGVKLEGFRRIVEREFIGHHRDDIDLALATRSMARG